MMDCMFVCLAVECRLCVYVIEQLALQCEAEDQLMTAANEGSHADFEMDRVSRQAVILNTHTLLSVRMPSLSVVPDIRIRDQAAENLKIGES